MLISLILVAVDTTQSTASDRVKFYINGDLITDFGTTSYPDQNESLYLNDACRQTWGVEDGGIDIYFADIHFIDGYQYDASYFGYTESQTGIWRPKKYEGTYQDNSYHLDFSDPTSLDTLGIDKSPLGNDYAAEGFQVSAGYNQDTLLDTPTKEYSILNNLHHNSTNTTFSNGNLYASIPASNTNGKAFGTIPIKTGKWYWEVKINNLSGSVMLGVLRQEYASTTLAKTSNAYMGSNSGDLSFSYRENGTFYFNGSTDTGNTSFSNDTIMLALDMDNGAIYTGKNGTWNDSGDPTSGASKTGASYTGISAGEFYSPATSMSSSDIDCILNAGQSNGVNVISSANADANGHGAFEYSVPSGYFAICTKNIAEQA